MDSNLTFSLLHWAVSALAILLTSKLIKNFAVDGFLTALLAAALIGIANYFVWPVLVFLTLPALGLADDAFLARLTLAAAGADTFFSLSAFSFPALSFARVFSLFSGETKYFPQFSQI